MKYLILATICLTILTAGVHAMIVTLSLDELVENSELIVTARVTNIETLEKTAENARLFADLPDEISLVNNQFEIKEFFKGTLPNDEKLTIRTQTGFEDATSFTKESNYLLFLKRYEDRYIVVNAPQGCWPIEENGKFSGMGHDSTMEQVKAAIK